MRKVQFATREDNNNSNNNRRRPRRRLFDDTLECIQRRNQEVREALERLSSRSNSGNEGNSSENEQRRRRPVATTEEQRRQIIDSEIEEIENRIREQSRTRSEFKIESSPDYSRPASEYLSELSKEYSEPEENIPQLEEPLSQEEWDEKFSEEAYGNKDYIKDIRKRNKENRNLTRRIFKVCLGMEREIRGHYP